MVIDGFHTKHVVDGDMVIATFVGTAESDNFEALAAFVREVDDAAGRARRVVADLRDLGFATSSCLKVLAGWVLMVEERSAPYTVEFLSNPQHSWQRRSLRALEACAPGVVRVRAT